MAFPSVSWRHTEPPVAVVLALGPGCGFQDGHLLPADARGGLAEGRLSERRGHGAEREQASRGL
jgi:hypothetical protein